jgi:hypothetical protein
MRARCGLPAKCFSNASEDRFVMATKPGVKIGTGKS